MENKVFGVYHSADNDGLMCAVIMKRANPEITLIGYDYGKPTTEIDNIPDGSVVFMADVSLKPDQMKALSERVTLVWIDHYASALESCLKQEDPEAIVPAEFDGYIGSIRTFYFKTFSACELCWIYFNPGAKMPSLVVTVGDYDVFRYNKTPHWQGVMSKEYGIRAYVQNRVDVMYSLFLESLESNRIMSHLAATGAAVYDFMSYENRSFVNRHHYMGELTFDNHTEVLKLKALIINRTELSSDFFSHIEKDIVVMYEITPKGISFSLRDHDQVGNICKAMGGGGHARAGGFVTEKWNAKVSDWGIIAYTDNARIKLQWI